MSEAHSPASSELLLYLEIAQRSAGMGYVSLDPVSMRLSLSNWVRDLVGAPPAIPLAQLPSYVVPDEREALTDTVGAIVSEPRPFEFETRLLVHGGGTLRVRVAGNAVYDDGQRGLIGFYAIVQDIEKIRAAEEAAHLAAERAERESAARGRVVATLSHEIRTPLTGILGIVDQLRREPRTEERQRALTLIEESTAALLGTLDGILAQVRSVETGGPEAMEPFDPVAIARRVAELFRPMALRKGIALEFAGSALAEGGLALGHPARLQQVLSNLVSNAVKFTAKGRVSLRCHASITDQPGWTFEVDDTGAGISRDRLANIFAEFGGSSSDSLGRDTGTGLGLSICKKLIESMDGTITVDSTEGKGTLVRVIVPLESPGKLGREIGTAAPVLYRCSSMSRGLIVMAAAESIGAFPKEHKDGDGIEKAIFICDAELAGSFDDEAIRSMKALILIREDGDRMDEPRADGAKTITAARLTSDLPGLLELCQK